MPGILLLTQTTPSLLLSSAATSFVFFFFFLLCSSPFCFFFFFSASSALFFVFLFSSLLGFGFFDCSTNGMGSKVKEGSVVWENGRAGLRFVLGLRLGFKGFAGNGGDGIRRWDFF